MQQRIAKFGFGFMIVSAVIIALYSLRFYGVPFGHWAMMDPQIREVIAAVPFRALTHMLVAPLALLFGALQFVRRLRDTHPKVHRYLGRLYVASCVIAGLGGLATAFHASGGPIAGLGFGILAVAWIGVTLGGWWAAVQRKLELHRLLMRLSYAMTFGAVTLRLQIPIGFMLGYTSYAAMSVWLAYTSWIPNVIVVGIYTALERTYERAVPSVARTRLALPGREPGSPNGWARRASTAGDRVQSGTYAGDAAHPKSGAGVQAFLFGHSAAAESVSAHKRVAGRGP